MQTGKNQKKKKRSKLHGYELSLIYSSPTALEGKEISLETTKQALYPSAVVPINSITVGKRVANLNKIILHLAFLTVD